MINNLRLYIQRYGFILGIKFFLSNCDVVNSIEFKKKIELLDNNKVIILTTKYILFVAYLLKYHLEKKGLEVQIIYKRPSNGFEDCLHYILAPHAFKYLPPAYVPFHLEQYMCFEKWHTKKHKWYLSNNNFPVFDYNQTNINYFIDNNTFTNKLYHLPIWYMPNYHKYLNIGNYDECYDILFYGGRNLRRDTFLNKIINKYNCKFILGDSPLVEDDIIVEIMKTKIIINIHAWNNSLLETTRLFECLSLDKLIISEVSLDQIYYRDLEEIIDFVELNNVDNMIARINYWLSNDNLRKQKILENKAKLKAMPNKFEIGLNDFLEDYFEY